MRIIDPSYEILTPITETASKLIEAAGRTCYKSEDKITPDSARAFVRKVIASGHESVIEHAGLTVRFICDRGVSHEIVRHRLASFSQESTRYCNYSSEKFGSQLTFIRPLWIDPFKAGADEEWYLMMARSESSYFKLLNEGWTPQQARSVLPNSLKTEIVVTANVREWRHIFRVRCTEKAHPQMRQLMVPLHEELKREAPEIFGEAL